MSKSQIDSKYIKACLSAYFRFKKGVKFIATECGRFNSDFLAIHKDMSIEVEIKTSKSDLNNDFKKKKHAIYETARHEWTPTQFYFAVPENLVEYAIAKCIDKKYGVMAISASSIGRRVSHYGIGRGDTVESRLATAKRTFNNVEYLGTRKFSYSNALYIEFEHDVELAWEEKVRVVKRAKKLTNHPPSDDMKVTMIARLSSEMARLRINEQVELLKNKK